MPHHIHPLHRFFFSFILIMLLTGCTGTPSVPLVEIKGIKEGDQVLILDTRTISINASGERDLQVKWETTRGNLSSTTSTSVIYTAPDSPGLDSISLTLTGRSGQVSRTVNFEIVLPSTPTFTSTPELPTTTSTIPNTFTPSPTQTEIPTFTITPSPVPTLTFTPSPSPNPTSTPIGGGSGQIVFSARDAEGDLEIYFLDLFSDDPKPINLTNNNTDDYSPNWSQDGSSIVFISSRDEEPDVWLMEISKDGQVLEEKNLTYKLGVHDSPVWTPDGDKIVFTRRIGEPKIYSINPDGTNEKQITTESGSYEHPSVSHPTSSSSKRIVFQKKIEIDSNNEYYALFIMDMNGGNQMQLLDGSTANDTSPAFSPDSTQIIFLSQISNQNNVWIVNSDGTNKKQITDDLADESSPSWSPDGNYIIFVSELGGDRAIYIMHKNENDSEKEKIISMSDINFPAWRP